MAVQELVTRQFEGHAEDGSPRYATTRHGRPRPPESVAEWAEQRIGALGAAASWPAGRVAVRLLLADGDAEVKAAVKAGDGLDEWQRYGVLQMIEIWRKQGYAPATGLMDGLYRAWTAKHGAKQPRPRQPASPKPGRVRPSDFTAVAQTGRTVHLPGMA